MKAVLRVAALRRIVFRTADPVNAFMVIPSFAFVSAAGNFILARYLLSIVPL